MTIKHSIFVKRTTSFESIPTVWGPFHFEVVWFWLEKYISFNLIFESELEAITKRFSDLCLQIMDRSSRFDTNRSGFIKKSATFIKDSGHYW